MTTFGQSLEWSIYRGLTVHIPGDGVYSEELKNTVCIQENSRERCFWLYHQPSITYDAARSKCFSLDMQLATLEHKDYIDEMEDLTTGLHGSTVHVWVGGKRKRNETFYVTYNGHVSQFGKYKKSSY